MLIIIMGILFFLMGIILMTLTAMFPVLRLIYLDWFAMFFMAVPYIFVTYRVWVTKSWKQVDRLPTWKHLINYMRRDNQIVPITGDRAYPGESFLDVPELGLIEFLGKDCVYQWGDKKVLWGLENVNFTPDPRYFNFTHLLYELGMKDSEDVANVLRGADLELMGTVYLNMLKYDKENGVNKLVTELKEYDGKKVDFKKDYEGKKKEMDKFFNKRFGT